MTRAALALILLASSVSFSGVYEHPGKAGQVQTLRKLSPHPSPLIASRSRALLPRRIATAQGPRGVGEQRTFTVTAYTWTGSRMANGRWPHPGAAASNLWPLGTRLYVQKIGTVTVEDRVGCCTQLDLYLGTRAACVRFGRQRLRVWRL